MKKNYTLIVGSLLVVIIGVIWLTAKNKPDQPVVMETEPVEQIEVVETAANSKPESISYVNISAEALKQLMENGAELTIIDVSPSYEQGHIPGAINYYLGNGSLDRAIPNLNPEKTYVVYCHVDEVSIAGAEKLVEAGFENVYRLAGNYGAWVEAGYEVESVK